MRRPTRSVWSLAAAAALVMGTAASAAAAPGSYRERPFTYTMEEATFEIVLDADWCEPPWIGVTMHVTEAHTSHMGRTTGEARHCVNGPVFDYGVLVIVAANGDELHGTYSGEFIGEGAVSYEEYEGGTGRFDNAAGSAVNLASIVFLTEFSGVLTGEATGTLTYDASDRAG